MVPKAHDAKIILREPAITFDIPDRVRMLAAIHLNNQTSLEADKIRDVPPDRNLATEFKRCKPAVLQRQPKLTLGVRHPRTQLAG